MVITFILLDLAFFFVKVWLLRKGAKFRMACCWLTLLRWRKTILNGFYNMGYDFLLYLPQEKLPYIAGSVCTLNKIRHSSSSVFSRLSAIIQRGGPLSNAVGHFNDPPQYQNTPRWHIILHLRGPNSSVIAPAFIANTICNHTPLTSFNNNYSYQLQRCNWKLVMYKYTHNFN